MDRFLFMDYSIIIRRNRIIQTITLYHRKEKEKKKKPPKSFWLFEDIILFVTIIRATLLYKKQFHIQVRICHEPSFSKSQTTNGKNFSVGGNGP